MTQQLLSREQVPLQHRWATEHIFASDVDWERAIVALDAEMEKLAVLRAQLDEQLSSAAGPSALLACLEQIENIRRRSSAVSSYAHLCYHVDTTDQASAGRLDRSRGVDARTAAATSFLNPQLLAIGFDTLDKWMAQEPKLAAYARVFDRLKQKRNHVRSAEVEAVLSMASDAFSTATATHAVLTNADLRFKPVTRTSSSDADEVENCEVTQATLASLVADPDRQVRRDAWQNYYDAHLGLKNTFANAMAGGMKRLAFSAQVRNYTSTLEASMQQNELPMSVFTNLIETFRRNLPLWHRYWKLRREALGYAELHPWDITAPLTAEPTQVSYQQAVDWICDGMQPLGEQYVQTMRRVDVYPNHGKRMGAFCSCGALPHPYVFLSYNGGLASLSTLAHELGHAMHGYYTFGEQKIWAYTSYGMFVAETASNFNQAMVRQHLYETQPDPCFRIAVIEEAFANFYRYLFIMPTLARLEQQVHQRVEAGQPLTSDVLINLMADLFEEGYGSEMIMDRQRVGITWATFPTHIYSSFYTFKYATGIAAANALAAGVRAGGADAAARYLEMLKSGGSRGPLETLQRAGVDMSTPQPVQAAFDLMSQWLDRLESLLAQVAEKRAST